MKKHAKKILVVSATIGLLCGTFVIPNLPSTLNAEDTTSTQATVTTSKRKFTTTTLLANVLVGFGGQEFIAQNNNILLARDVTGIGKYADDTGYDTDSGHPETPAQAQDYSKSKARKKAIEFAGKLTEFDKNYLVKHGEDEAFIPTLDQVVAINDGKLSSDDFWTSTEGALETDMRGYIDQSLGKMRVITKSGIKDPDVSQKWRAVNLTGPKVQYDTCPNAATTRTEKNGKNAYEFEYLNTLESKVYIHGRCTVFGTTNYFNSDQFFWARKDYAWAIKQEIAARAAGTSKDILYMPIGVTGNELVSGTTGAQLSVTFGSYLVMEPVIQKDVFLDDEGNVPNNGNCPVTREAHESGYRPAVEIVADDIQYVLDASTGTVAKPDTSVKLAMKSDKLGLSITRMPDVESISNELERATTETVEFDYDVTNTTGEVNTLIAIYTNAKGDIVAYDEIADNVTGTGTASVKFQNLTDGSISELGKYTVDIYNVVKTGANETQLTSTGQSFEVNLTYGLSDGEVTLNGTKIKDENGADADGYNEAGVIIKPNITDASNLIFNNYIRAGKKEDFADGALTPAQWVAGGTGAAYKGDGVYGPVPVLDDITGEQKVDDKGNPVFNYDNCLYVQVANNTGTNPADPQKVSSILRLDKTIIVDTKAPKWSSKDSDGIEPFTTENVKKEEETTGFSLFGLFEPDENLPKDYSGENIKLYPNVSDYETNSAGAEIKGGTGIKAIKVVAKPLGTDEKVDSTKAPIELTIDPKDEKFKQADSTYKPYFELSGRDAFWIKLTATDMGGRTATYESKLYMDSTAAAAPVVETKKDDADSEAGTPASDYVGVTKNEADEDVIVWSGIDVNIDLSLTDQDLKDLVSGVDHYEYISKTDYDTQKAAILAADPTKKDDEVEEAIVWTSVGYDKDPVSGNDVPKTKVKASDLKGGLSYVDDLYYFRAVSKANINGLKQEVHLHVDFEKPELEVKAYNLEKDKEYAYSDGRAKKGIRFTVKKPDGVDDPKSGVRYYYRGVPLNWSPDTPSTLADTETPLPSDTEIPWTEIQKDKKTGKYEFIVTDDFSGTYYFKAENGGGLAIDEAKVKKFSAQVGVEQPATAIKVSAKTVDDAGSEIDYDGKWTSKPITLTLTGGLDAPNTAARYEYASSPTSTTWTPVNKGADNTFKLEFNGSNSVNQTLYFRVIAEGDTSEVPYSTQKEGTRVQYDPNIPSIKKIELSPDPSNDDASKREISAGYVTMVIQCQEKDVDEYANASPIAAYSVDGGATWINASSQNSRTFKYDFTQNVSATIWVKDTAGNILKYADTIEINNIDKTGPNAPKITSLDDFKGGVWQNSALSIAMNFDMATTGAKEKLQYYVLAFDGTDYKQAFSDGTFGNPGDKPVFEDAAGFGVAQATLLLDQQGVYKLAVRTIDEMGRYSESASIHTDIRIDLTKPTTKTVQEIPDKWGATVLNFLTAGTFYKDHVTYQLTGEDQGGSGLDKFQYQLTTTGGALDDTKWKDCYNGEINVEEDFEGDIYVRAVDKAGNIEDPIQKIADGILVDAGQPDLSITPEKWGDTYKNESSIQVHAEDQGTGISNLGDVAFTSGAIQYTSTYGPSVAGTIGLDTNGNAVIGKLPEGSYTLTITVSDNANHTETIDYPVKIDKGTPELAINDPDSSGIVRSKTVYIETKNTIAGQKSLKVFKNGTEIKGLKESTKPATTLTGDRVKVYELEITENAKYDVELIGNAVSGGVNVSANATFTVDNVYNVDPILKVEAFIGDDKTYVSDEWTSDHIEVALSNTEPLISNSDLVFQYKQYDGDTLATPDWVDIDDSKLTSTTGRFSVYNNGVHTYIFRAVMKDDAGNIIVSSNEESITTKQDIVQPDTPVIQSALLYDRDTWYDTAQTIEVAFNENKDGIGQWVEYNLDHEKNGAALVWRKAQYNETTGFYEIKVKGDAKHEVTVRANDYYGRYSASSDIFVNIDAQGPKVKTKLEYKTSSVVVQLLDKDDKGTNLFGVSGLERATLTKIDDTTNLPDPNKQQNFIGNKVTVTKDNYGNGKYQLSMKSVSGKIVREEIEINGINLPKPQLALQAQSVKGGVRTAYVNDTWVNADSVEITASVTNGDTCGDVIYEWQEDGDFTWTSFADASPTMTSVTGDGVHRINVRAQNVSGVYSDVVSFTANISSTWDPTITIADVANYPTDDSKWYNTTQKISVSFVKNTSGSPEWIEFSEDGTNWSRDSRNTYEIKETGKHTLFIRKNDVMGNGNASTGTELHVNIDKKPIQGFYVEIGENRFSKILSTITFGLYENTTKQAIIGSDDDFLPSGEGDIYIQIVEDPSEYVNTYAATPTDPGWQKYSAPVPLQHNFKGFVYAKAKDKAGNMTNIIRTDGIVIDTVEPDITIKDNGGDWINGNKVQVDVSDTNTVAGEADHASGIQKISFETSEAVPYEGEVDVEDGVAFIDGLNNGSYELSVKGSDRAGNSRTVKAQIKIDNEPLDLTIRNFEPLAYIKSQDITLVPYVGESGIDSIVVNADLEDGASITDEVIAAPYTYKITKNGTYRFTLKNNAGAELTKNLEVNNISDSSDTMNALEITTTNEDGDKVPYNNCEDQPGTPAAPSWTGHNVVLLAHGSAVKYKASVDGAPYKDFNLDNTFTIDKEGIYTVNIRNSVDTSIRTIHVKIDKNKIANVAIQDPKHLYRKDENRWFNTQQYIQATYTKGNTGIDEWIEYYDANKGGWVRQDGVTLDQDGKHVVKFRGNDELNRPSDEVIAYANLDMSAPSDLRIELKKNSLISLGHYLFPNIFDEEITAKIHANADISGLDRIEYQLINEELGETYTPLFGWKRYDDSGIAIPDQFKGKIYAKAYDKANNQTIIISTEDGIIVDKEQPRITFQTTPSDDASAWTNENSVKVKIDVPISGIAEIKYTTHANGIDLDHKVDVKQLSSDGTFMIENLPDGYYPIDVIVRSKAGVSTKETLSNVKIDTKAPIISIDADLEKKATSMQVNVSVDTSALKNGNTLTSLTWETYGTTPVDILAEPHSFTVTNNGVYRIVAVTSAGVTAEKLLYVDNISSLSSVLGISAYHVDDNTVYQGGDTWTSRDVRLNVKDITGKVESDKLSVEYRIIDLDNPDGATNVVQTWSVLDANADDTFSVVASKEGHYTYEFRGTYQGVVGASAFFNVFIDRSTPVKPSFSQDSLNLYDNDAWHSVHEASVEASLNRTAGCNEWVEYNIDGQTDFDGNERWTALGAELGTIKVVDDANHKILIRTKDALGRISESEVLEVKLDSTSPTDFYIKAGDNVFKNFLTQITGGVFFSESTTIQIDGNFDIAGLGYIEYQFVNKGDTFDAATGWKKLSASKTFEVLPNSSGIIYARGVDKAGNSTGIISSDLITIDQSAPVLLVPADADEFTNDNTMTIYVKDDESGLHYVTYHSDDPYNDGEIELEEGTFDPLGTGELYRKGIIKNLKDGDYLLEVIAYDKAGVTQTKKPRVMIDTVTPALEYDESQLTQPKAKVELDLIPIVGGSGLKEIQRLDKDAPDAVVVETIPAVDGFDSYLYTFIENGTYYFRVVNNAEKESDIYTIHINNIRSDAPQIVIRTDNGYTSPAWSGKPVNLEVNTNTNAKLQYRKQGEATWIDAPHDYYASLLVDTTGTHIYEFRAYDVVDNTKETIETYKVCVDLQAPKKPSIKNPNEFGDGHWYKDSKDITVIRNTDPYLDGTTYEMGSAESLWYYIKGDDDPTTGQPNWQAVPGNDTVSITTHGRNVVIFKLIDEVTDHITYSDEVIVNIFNTEPQLNVGVPAVQAKTLNMTIQVTPPTADDPIRRLTVEKQGGDKEAINTVVDKYDYLYTVKENGVYTVEVQMESGAYKSINITVTTIIEEDPILTVSAESGGNPYTFGDWAADDVSVSAVNATLPTGYKIQYRIKENGSWSAYQDQDTTTNAVVFNTEGNFVIQYALLQSVAGGDIVLQEMGEKYAVKIDKTIPADVTILNDSQYGTGKVFNKPVNVQTSFAPDGAGAKEWVQYSIDKGVNWINGSSKLFQTDGSYEIWFRAIDEAGRTSANISKAIFAIDTQAAGSLTMDIKGNKSSTYLNNITFKNYYTSSDAITFTLTDAPANTDIYYQFADNLDGYVDDASAWIKYDASTTLSAPANFKGSLYAYAQSPSGSRSAIIRSNGITVDDDKPIITMPADMTTWSAENIYEFEISDTLAGVNETSVKYSTCTDVTCTTKTITDQPVTEFANGKGSIDLVDGKYFVEIKASDKAGNAADPMIREVMINADAPTIGFTDALQTGGESSKLSVTVISMPSSGLSGIYVREKNSGWKKIGDGSSQTADMLVYRNGVYEAKAVNGAGKESAIATLTVNNITETIPDFDLRTTDGFLFGEYWNRPLTIEVLSQNADEIYYSTNGANGSWFDYKEKGKIEITKNGAFQYTFKLVKDGKEWISFPYDVRVVLDKVKEPVITPIQANAKTTPFYYSFFRSARASVTWNKPNYQLHISKPDQPTDGGNLQYGTYIQVVQLDNNNNPIHYNEHNYTLLENEDNIVTFKNEGRWRLYSFTGAYVAGEEQNFYRFQEDTIQDVYIDGTAPDTFTLKTEVDGTMQFLHNITGGLFFKDTIEVLPEATDALSGIESYEFQAISCTADACDVVSPAEDDWEEATSYHIAEDFAGVLYARAKDYAGNVIEKEVQLTINADTTTYTLEQDITGWKHYDTLSVIVSPSTRGVVDMQARFDDGSYTSMKALDHEQHRYEIENVPEGAHTLSIVAFENGGNKITYPDVAVQIDRTDPTLTVEIRKTNDAPWEQFLNNVTFKQFFKPGIALRASASDLAGESETGEVRIEYQSDHDTTWKAYDSEIRFDQEDIEHVYFRAVDQAGNISDIVDSEGVVIDGSAPAISGVENNASYWLPHRVYYQDSISGIKAATLTKDGNAQPITNGILLQEKGSYYVQVSDQADNEASVSFLIKGLQDLKEEEINDSLIQEIEKEFNEQKPGYGKDLSEQIQKEIEDLKKKHSQDNQGNEPTPGDDSNGSNGGSTGNGDNGNGTNGNSGNGNSGNIGNNGNSGTAGNDAQISNGNGTGQGTSSQNKDTNLGNTGNTNGNYNGMGGSLMQNANPNASNANAAGAVATGDLPMSILYGMLAICALTLMALIIVKQRLCKGR